MGNLIASIIKKSQQREVMIHNTPGIGALDKVRELRDEAKTQISALNTYISAYAVESKNKRTGTVGLVRALKSIAAIDESEALPILSNPGEDIIMCPETKTAMDRNGCLDNQENNPEMCEYCEIGSETKRLLLPPRE